ncbi:hypothetical protein DFA_08372 [Cavenderia fasciculata]|uniref:Large ribosomal subunit protein uL29m n=1 Tax=Cavenderia fasciculata TaxID=261658 RepID=F4Q5W8_CACFS|nr:uncharacterized protein DFA_08372 [Cavenderia fasciculata]EGG17377.1 hypothetical protein DFA_08372 [Cavenderia fasciculata]|eukprot:XP_004355861.1 hypothetical protein DFA_08372 [Cavenderia fasciculata]
MSSSSLLYRTSSLIRRSMISMTNTSTSSTSSTFITRSSSDAKGLQQFFEHEYPKGTYPLAGKKWEARDLRGKSFEDLHKLWFVLLKERNKLMSERENAKDHKLTNPFRLQKVRKSMTAIKTVLGERDSLRKELYILTKCADNERKDVQKRVDYFKNLVGAVSLTPGLKELEELQESLKVDLSLEESIDNLTNLKSN